MLLLGSLDVIDCPEMEMYYLAHDFLAAHNGSLLDILLSIH